MASFFSDALQYTSNTLQYCTTNFRINDILHSALLCATHIASHTRPVTTDLQSPLSLPQSHVQLPSESWPHTPFTTNGSQILNALSAPVVFVGVNWPAHGKTMIPEGLQYQSIRQIVSQIKDLGMNVVRLTYATEMVDDLYARESVDVSLPESLIRGLGYQDGKRLYREIVMRNPEFGDWRTTRFDVLDAVAEELAEQHIYVHLDNHISKAGWCCSLDDGNGWFNDTYFSPQNWTRGLNFMSHRARHSHKWRGLTSLSLRNEPRDTPNNPFSRATYNWSTWYDYMIPAAETLHAVNPDPLIFVSGLNFDTDLGPVVRGEDLSSLEIDHISSEAQETQWIDGNNRRVKEIKPEDNNVHASKPDPPPNPANEAKDRKYHNKKPQTHNPLNSIRLKGEQAMQQENPPKQQQPPPPPPTQQPITKKVFNLTSLPYHNKLVFELHTYRLDITNCTTFKNDLLNAGYSATFPPSSSSPSSSFHPQNKAPVILTEFGFPQDNKTYTQPYASCLKSFLTDIGGGWMYWVLAGSYYERSGILDYDETWGLLRKDWSGWRSPGDVHGYFRGFVEDSLNGGGK